MSVLWALFMTFFKIGLFSFGGGYAMIPLMESEVIDMRGWLTNAEFIDIIAISEMTPGPVSINSSTFVGYSVGGTLGSILATTGVVLPSLIVMLTLLTFITKAKDSKYIDLIFKGIRPIVLGLIASAAVSVAFSSIIDFKSALIAVGIFYMVAIRNINPIISIITAGGLGLLLY